MEDKTTGKDVYETLRDEIIFLTLEPGMVISEIETSKRFNISRTPIRDVFKRLEQEGLINVVSHVGTFISKIDIERISDTLYVREKVELAILKDLINIVSEDQIFKLQIIISNQEDKAKTFASLTPEEKKNQAREFLALDDEFHKAFFDITGRNGVWQYLFQNELHYRRFRMFLNTLNNSNLQGLVDEHKELLKAIADKDFEACKKIVSKHIYGGIRQVSSDVYEQINYFRK